MEDYSKELVITNNYDVRPVAYSPDGKYIASGSRDESVRVWDAKSGACVATLKGHSNSVNSVAYSPDGQYIASGSLDKTIKIWQLVKRRIRLFNSQSHYWKCKITLNTHSHSGSVYTVAFSPDGRRIASGSTDNSVRVWDADTDSDSYGTCIKTLNGHPNPVWSVAYSPDGKYIASGSEDKSVRVWDAKSGTCVATLEGHTSYV